MFHQMFQFPGQNTKLRRRSGRSGEWEGPDCKGAGRQPDYPLENGKENEDVLKRQGFFLKIRRKNRTAKPAARAQAGPFR